jgi:F420-dependent oxidoreductase-like protein
MKIGMLLERFDWPGGPSAMGPTLARIAREAEQAGVCSLWVNDHFFQIPMFGEVADPVLESYTTLAYVAAATQRLELGTLTTGGHHRYPGPLLKIVVTLDVLSGGRAWFGVGPAWNEREQRGLGIPVIPWPQRFERLDELLRLTHHVWDGDTGPFEGKHYRLDEPLFSPRPVRRPPILVGGSHERRVFPLVARYADACSLFDSGGGELVAFKLNILRRCCDEVGRDFAELVKTTFGTLSLSSVPAAVEHFRALSELGIDMAIVALDDVTNPSSMDRLADVVSAVSAMAPC